MLTKSLKNLWARFLFQDRGILPTKRLLWIYLGISVFFVLLGGFLPISWPVIIIMNLFILAASLADVFFSPRKEELSLMRTLPDEWERGLPYTIHMQVENRSEYPFSYAFVDDLPQSFLRPFPVVGKGEKRAVTQASYNTRASVRGDYAVNKLYFRYQSVWGLWEKQITVEIPQEVKVIPDMTETKHYLQDAQKFLLHEGEKIRKYSSGSGEFAQIRKYAAGDDPRMINWRQTAKLQEVMTNEYEPEHGKYITILLDCGRMMGAELKKGNRLERSLEAAMTVAAAALKKGDYVSVLVFSKGVKGYVPPAKGMEHLQLILKTIYSVQADPVESNYGAVFSFLETMQKKRSLLLLFSDIRAFLYEESMLDHLMKIRRRHVFFMIGVKDEAVQRRISERPNHVEQAMIKSIAQQQMLFQKREKANWESRGLLMVETEEGKLASAAVSYYIDMMNRNLL
ncbi:DUF58 domain-containing protein [Siminovitchia sediminis]|uniref:DUF58 domain-containing protein n=1 Tax=Siminovitchia sediminis TaxID=1274353 RepID=A0ABW4KHL3_9BACI